MSLSKKQHWCVFLCTKDLDIKRIISIHNLHLSVAEGDSLATLMDPDNLDKYFTFLMEVKNKKTIFFYEMLILDDLKHPHVLEFSCIRYDELCFVTATSTDMDLYEELIAINSELSNSLRQHIKESSPPANYLEQFSGLNNELINMKRELVQKNVAISQLLAKKEAMNAQLEELIKTKDMLFSILAHDLRSPLANTMNLMNLISFDRESYEYAVEEGLFNNIHESTAKTLRLLEDLLQWYRYNKDDDLIHKQVFDPAELVQQTLQYFDLEAAHKNIKLAQISPESTQAYADPNMISTVLRNVLSNALKFTPAGGNITVEISDEPTTCCFTVSDTGIGIAGEKLPLLFTLHNHKSTIGLSGESGSGFGLVLSREMIEKNQGTIQAESTPGKGTCIIFRVPKNEVPAS